MSDNAVSKPRDTAAGARLLVLILAFAWGLNWIATAIGLREVPPWSLRFLGNGLGALTLISGVYLSGRSLSVSTKAFWHIALAGLLNIALFNICDAFSQLSGATSRTVVITYSMPIWSAVGAWLVLGDRMDRVRVLALALCIGGLAILLSPLFAAGVPRGALFAFGSAFGWATATVYLKWADIGVDPLVNATWQLIVGAGVLGIGMLIAEGVPKVWPISATSIAAIVFIGVIGSGLAQFLWWSIVGKLPTMTASLGSLLVPVVGVTASVFILGERPTLNDALGFAMIFAAAACVLLRPGVKHTEMPE